MNNNSSKLLNHNQYYGSRIRCFLTPGSGTRIQMNILNLIIVNLESVFGLKILEFFDAAADGQAKTLTNGGRQILTLNNNSMEH